MKILVTGSAGFIGFYLVKKLAERGDEVVGLDNINDYYDVRLKYSRLAETGIDRKVIEEKKSIRSVIYPGYRFIKADLTDREFIARLMEEERFDKVCNLAAQAGVRYSIENPFAYIDSNIIGFMNLLEACRQSGITHFVYASSSSVYGLNEKVPYCETDQTDRPVSLYAATKKADELMARVRIMKFAYDIIKKPIITERSMMGAQNNKYTFEVAADAGKIEIKKAVEEIFGVKVMKVNTIKLPGKWKRMGVHVGKRPDIKKAVVTLTPDSKKIEIFENMM